MLPARDSPTTCVAGNGANREEIPRAPHASPLHSQVVFRRSVRHNFQPTVVALWEQLRFLLFLVDALRLFGCQQPTGPLYGTGPTVWSGLVWEILDLNQ